MVQTFCDYYNKSHRYTDKAVKILENITMNHFINDSSWMILLNSFKWFKWINQSRHIKKANEMEVTGALNWSVVTFYYHESAGLGSVVIPDSFWTTLSNELKWFKGVNFNIKNRNQFKLRHSVIQEVQLIPNKSADLWSIIINDSFWTNLLKEFKWFKWINLVIIRWMCLTGSAFFKKIKSDWS